MSSTIADAGQVGADFKKAMRRLAATVTIISTADVNGNRFGMTATAVNSLTMEPPSLLICVKIAAVGPKVDAPAGAESIDALGRVLMPGFIDCHTHACWAGDRLDEWIQKLSGVPYLENAQCSLICNVDRVVPYATHSVVIGRVTTVRVAEGIRPLIFADGRLGATQALTGHVRIAANLSTITQFLPSDLESFLHKQPLIDVHLEEKVSTAVVTAVQENACDIGLIEGGGPKFVPMYGKIVSSTPSLETSFDLKESGSSSTSPSRLPRMLVEYQPSTPNSRALSPGAMTVFIHVWPVLKSLPEIGMRRSRAR